MSTYVLADKAAAGPEEGLLPLGKPGHMALAIFTDRRAAERCAAAEGWPHPCRLHRLSAMEFLQWMMSAHRQGIQYLVVNAPGPKLPEDDLPTLAIEEQLARFAELLTESVVRRANRVPSPERRSEVPSL